MSEGSEPIQLISRYRAMVKSGELLADPEQNLAIDKLSLLANRLARNEESSRGFASAIFGWGRETVRQDPLEGLYIYGSVGRGKSMVMQLFVDAVGDQAWRVHFHEFMQGVQRDLTAIRKTNVREPLDEIAEQISQRCKVLCLDEMQIENIADAMIVGRLFEGIFERGVVLVTTSNRHPDDLYKGGLNRHRFTPFIEIIKTHCEVVSLDGPVDYRQKLETHSRYFVGETTSLDEIWSAIAGNESAFVLKIATRIWPIDRVKPASNPRAARLSFADVCEAARGAKDYQALADQFPTLMIENIPKLNREKTSAATRFVTLIDILYEANTVLYLGLDVPLDMLHSDKNTRFVFDRTRSRLNEMQSVNWGVQPD